LNDFHADLKYSLENRDDITLNDFYKKAFPLAESVAFCEDLTLQKKSIDKIIRFKNGKSVTVDEKKRRVDYGDILLELWSNKERKKAGWLFYSECDYIVYAVLPAGVAYLLPVLLLQMAWKNNRAEWERSYKKHLADNKLYRTENIAIPTNVLLYAISAEMKKAV